jgi:sRNA-binding regulator protein Hfq
MDNTSKLLELAKQKFATLSEPDTKLFLAVGKGEPADYSEKEGEERNVKANHIEWLCTDKRASKLVTHRGIQIKGAHVEGKLDLSFAKISFPLIFEKCAVPMEIDLRHAEIFGLKMTGTHTGPLNAYDLRVAHDLCLQDDFKATGEVGLSGAIIGGTLNCDKGEFINAGGVALRADRLKVEGGVYLRNGFRAEGEVCLRGATIGEALHCDKGQFINARVVLRADRLKVQGAVFLCNHFKAEGTVSLVGATIGGTLNCDKGEFINAGGCALSADGLKVKGNVFFRNSFRAEGSMSLVGASMDNYFVWTGIDSVEKVTLDLRSAKIGTLWDEQKSWPNSGKLLLHGLVYDQIHDDAPRDAETRIAWLRRQYNEEAEQDKKQFRPQPYEQLATVLRKSGREEDAKDILIYKNKDRARYTKLMWSQWLWYHLFGPIIGYGYRPWRAFWLSLSVIVVGWFLFGIGYWNGLITPQTESAYVERDTKIFDPGDKKRHISDVYPRFNAFVYSLDLFVPLVDLEHSKYLLPNANRGRELFNVMGLPVRFGGVLRLYMWFHIALGWIFTSLLVVGLTGLVRT